MNNSSAYKLVDLTRHHIRAMLRNASRSGRCRLRPRRMHLHTLMDRSTWRLKPTSTTAPMSTVQQLHGVRGSGVDWLKLHDDGDNIEDDTASSASAVPGELSPSLSLTLGPTYMTNTVRRLIQSLCTHDLDNFLRFFHNVPALLFGSMCSGT